MRRTLDQVRAELSMRLHSRRPEIVRAVLTRAHAVADPATVPDPRYADGLRAAVAAAVDYGLAGLEHGEKRAAPIPAVLLAQARIAARNGVSLDTVLRRYLAGYTLLGDYLISALQQEGASAELPALMRDQATLFDRLLAKVSEEHGREESRPLTSERRHAERLLNGELLDVSDLAYAFDATHVGVIVSGHGAAAAIRQLASSIDRRLLSVRYDEETVWAWLGGQWGAGLTELRRFISASWPAQVTLAVGEPGDGLPGWRLTHEQAKAALPIALRSGQRFIRYADVALLASILQDELLSTSLHQLYLAPLEGERDGGETFRETLRAYFSAGRNGASAAAALEVSRQTISNRLQAAEARLGRPLVTCELELEAALRLENLGRTPQVSSKSRIP